MFSFSIAMSSTSATRDSRTSGSKTSSSCCFSSIASCRLAAMVSASLAGSSMRSAAAVVSWFSDCCSLHVLLKQLMHALRPVARSAASTPARRCEVLHGRDEEPVVVVDLGRAGALHAFHQHLDVAVGHAHALHDVADRADRVDIVGVGSSTDASCWVARKILRSPFSASSSARTLDSRPTTKGVIMCGKITMSRMGIIGSLRIVAGQDVAFVVCHMLS